MSNLQAKIEASLSKESDGKTFDIVTIAMLLSIVYAVVKLWQNCNKTPEQIVESAKNPSLMHKFRLKRMIRQEVSEQDYQKDGNNLYRALLDTGRNLAPEDVLEVQNEII